MCIRLLVTCLHPHPGGMEKQWQRPEPIATSAADAGRRSYAAAYARRRSCGRGASRAAVLRRQRYLGVVGRSDSRGNIEKLLRAGAKGVLEFDGALRHHFQLQIHFES